MSYAKHSLANLKIHLLHEIDIFLQLYEIAESMQSSAFKQFMHSEGVFDLIADKCMKAVDEYREDSKRGVI